MESKYEEMEEDEFRRGKGVTEIEALREWKKIPEHIRRLLLANAFCYGCGTTEFAPRALPRASGQHGSRQVRPNLRRSQGQTVHLQPHQARDTRVPSGPNR